MAAPDTSFHPTPPREERHPGLDLREHPVSPGPGDAWGGENGYFADIPLLSIEARLAELPGSRDIART